ncbi:MAG: hypothetical protein WC556_11550 [Candidatus Methanoperedens sp.]
MKWIYILIVLVISAFTLGCVDKNQPDTTTGTYGERGNIDFAPDVNQNLAETSSEVPLTPEPGEDLGTYSDLAEMDNISSDLDMQITLSNEI